jgi:hypothetical protein
MTRAATFISFSCLLVVGVAAAKGSNQESPSTSVGLPVGQKAPSFKLRDQFYRTQSNETLKGPNGTILLFFRSADW